MVSPEQLQKALGLLQQGYKVHVRKRHVNPKGGKRFNLILPKPFREGGVKVHNISQELFLVLVTDGFIERTQNKPAEVVFELREEHKLKA